MIRRGIKQGIGVAAVALMAAGGMVACEESEGPSGTSSGGGSTHNAGRNCAQSGCHSNLKYAGTIYSDVSGSSAVSGATVVITETDGTSITMTSDSAGNFYSESGNPANGYTATVDGNTIQMVTAPTNGGCNAGGCHDGAATARVYTN